MRSSARHLVRTSDNHSRRLDRTVEHSTACNDRVIVSPRKRRAVSSQTPRGRVSSRLGQPPVPSVSTVYPRQHLSFENRGEYTQRADHVNAQRPSQPEQPSDQRSPRRQPDYVPSHRNVILLSPRKALVASASARTVTTYIDANNPIIPIRGPDARSNVAVRASSTREFQRQLANSSRPHSRKSAKDVPLARSPSSAVPEPSSTVSQRFAGRLVIRKPY